MSESDTITLTPGCYIDSHWGHYQSVRILEIALDLGWEPNGYSVDEIYERIRAYNESEVPTLEGKPLDENEDDAIDHVYWLQEEAEEYINETHVPEGHWFGHHADIGDVGVWSVHMDCTPRWCEAACEPNSRCPEFRKEDA